MTEARRNMVICSNCSKPLRDVWYTPSCMGIKLLYMREDLSKPESRRLESLSNYDFSFNEDIDVTQAKEENTKTKYQFEVKNVCAYCGENMTHYSHTKTVGIVRGYNPSSSIHNITKLINRGRCPICYINIKRSEGSQTAQSRTPRTKNYCKECKKFYCKTC